MKGVVIMLNITDLTKKSLLALALGSDLTIYGEENKQPQKELPPPPPPAEKACPQKRPDAKCPKAECPGKPFAEMRREMRQRMMDDPFFDDDFFFAPVFQDAFMNMPRPDFRRAEAMQTSVQETEKAYVIQIATPGVPKEELNVVLDGNMLCIERKKAEKTEKEGSKKQSDFQYRSCYRLAPNADREKISAVYKDGMLKVELPKKPVEPKQVKKIEIK